MRKPWTETGNFVWSVYEKYVKENTYTDGIGNEFKRLGMDPDYAYIIFHYVKIMKEKNMWDICVKEKWPLKKVINYLNTVDQEEKNEKKALIL